MGKAKMIHGVKQEGEDVGSEMPQTQTTNKTNSTYTYGQQKRKKIERWLRSCLMQNKNLPLSLFGRIKLECKCFYLILSIIFFRQEQRKVNKEFSSYNFEEAQYVNEKRKIENSHPLPHVKLYQKINSKLY